MNPPSTQAIQGTENYIGRFAPSPSGPLHFGSLITALASFLDAKHHQGRWLLRMEDIDPPREEKGAKQWILHSLEAHGLEWDGPVLYQSQRIEAYNDALLQLKDYTYPCSCNRARLLKLNGVYDGHCLTNPLANNPISSLRLSLEGLLDTKHQWVEHYQDIFQGQQHQSLHQEVGDFILRRKDGLIAYQLAVVVDDIEQKITHIIRGSDLLFCTPQQRYLSQLLTCQSPAYGHIPVATNSARQKLSKQNKAKGIDNQSAFDNLSQALIFLHHPAPVDIIGNRNIHDLLTWAIQHWQRQNIPAVMSFTANHTPALL